MGTLRYLIGLAVLASLALSAVAVAQLRETEGPAGGLSNEVVRIGDPCLGDDDESDDESSDDPCAGPAFVPDEPAPGRNTVSMAEGAVLGDMITIHVNVTDTSDVFAASFDVVYDPALVGFVGWSPGTVLESGGVTPFYLVSASPESVAVGASRVGLGAGVDVAGTETLIALTFVTLGPGSSAASFRNAALIDSTSPPQPIPNVLWFGGVYSAD